MQSHGGCWEPVFFLDFFCLWWFSGETFFFLLMFDLVVV